MSRVAVVGGGGRPPRASCKLNGPGTADHALSASLGGLGKWVKNAFAPFTLFEVPIRDGYLASFKRQDFRQTCLGAFYSTESVNKSSVDLN
jgi:hypothetical protein